MQVYCLSFISLYAWYWTCNGCDLLCHEMCYCALGHLDIRILCFVLQKIAGRVLWGRYDGGWWPSSDDSFHSPTVIPQSALNKLSIMKHYHRQWTCSHTSPRRSLTMVTLYDTRFAECRWWNDSWTVKTVVTWPLSASMIPALEHNFNFILPGRTGLLWAHCLQKITKRNGNLKYLHSSFSEQEWVVFKKTSALVVSWQQPQWGEERGGRGRGRSWELWQGICWLSWMHQCHL